MDKIIPPKYLSKMCELEMEFNGCKVRVKTADSPSNINSHLSELRSHMTTNGIDVVGVDIKKKLVNHSDPNICFVGVSNFPSCGCDRFSYLRFGIEVGDLAARVLRRPDLIESSLVEIARDPEIQIPYEPPSGGVTTEFQVYENNHTVLSDEQIMVAMNEAFAYYLIGHKLLSSLK